MRVGVLAVESGDGRLPKISQTKSCLLYRVIDCARHLLRRRLWAKERLEEGAVVVQNGGARDRTSCLASFPRITCTCSSGSRTYLDSVPPEHTLLHSSLGFRDTVFLSFAEGGVFRCFLLQLRSCSHSDQRKVNCESSLRTPGPPVRFHLT